MDNDLIIIKIAEIKRQIAQLPSGSLKTRQKDGREYFVHRWYEDKKRREKYVPVKEADALRMQIEMRKRLEKELKTLRKIVSERCRGEAPDKSEDDDWFS